MTIPLKQSTAGQEIPLGYFLDSTDGNTEETGLTISNTDIKIWKTGATTLANKNSGDATHISNGIYYCVLDATDTNTAGAMVVFVHESGALSVKVDCIVYPANVYDSLFSTDNLQVDVVQLDSGAQSLWDLKAFADLGYNPSTNKVIGVETVDAMSTAMKAEINAEVVDVIRTDTSVEPTQGAPTATPTLEAMIKTLYFMVRNKTVTTSVEKAIYADNGTTKIMKETLSDDGSTLTESEYTTGA